MKYLLLVFVFLNTISFGQVKTDSTKLFDQSKCFIEYFNDKQETVFTKIETPASFKGGSDTFLNFLILNIDFNSIVTDLKQDERLYADTATVKFIISKKGILSDLTVVDTKKEIFRQKLIETIKKSSCFWVPGNFSGRLVNGWYQLKIFYIIDRRAQEISIKVGYDMIENK